MPFAVKSLLSLTILAAAATVGIAIGQTTPPASAPSPQDIVRQAGMRSPAVHDPSTIVKCGDDYWVFATGNLTPSWHSKDLITWENGGNTFSAVPAWVRQEVPVFNGTNFWAPDVIKVKDQYLLFFSASGFGVNTSTIGVISSPTLDKNDAKYQWTDGGKVVTSHTNDDFNAIDPAAILDTDGKLWLSFGSFWSGIKLIELDPNTGKRVAEDSPIYSIAHWDSIEGSYIYKHDNKYYLFVCLGMCCRQAGSTYNMRIGRADKITGPYTDKAGKDLLLGGGTPFLESQLGPLIGPGHAGIVQVGNKYFLSCHYESNATRGGTLSIRPLTWDPQGWPIAGIAQ